MQIPLLVRSGAIIPQLPPDVDTLTPATHPAVRAANADLVIEIFPAADGGEATFQLWDGTALFWNPQSGRFRAIGAPVERNYTLRVRDLRAIGRAFFAGRELPQSVSAEFGWWSEDDKRVTCARVRGRDVVVDFHLS